MSKLSFPAIVVAVIFIIAGTFAKDLVYQSEGGMTYLVDAGVGAVSALIGGIIGVLVFPKRGEKDD